MSLCDLLHPTPVLRIDAEHTKLAIAMAFASGVSGGLFSEALERARVAPSSWEPAAFANDLFVPSFVASSLCVRIDGGEPLAVSTKYLTAILTHPPRDLATVAHRREILSELAASAPLRRELEQLYLSLAKLRNLLEGAGGVGKFAPERRQLDILLTYKQVVERMSAGFRGARSGLAALAASGDRVKAGEPYRSLTDLLRYDEKLATLNLTVSVGADGRLRGFRVLSVEEDSQNPFVTSPLRRWLGKLELFVRGFSFSDGEIMARLIDAVFDGIEDELPPLVQLFGDLEFYLGALGFRDAALAANLPCCMPEFGEDATLARSVGYGIRCSSRTASGPCRATS